MLNLQIFQFILNVQTSKYNVVAATNKAEWSFGYAFLGIVTAAAAYFLFKYASRFIGNILFQAADKTKTTIDDNLISALIFTMKTAAILFGVISFVYFETKFLHAKYSNVSDLFTQTLFITLYFLITIFLWQVISIVYQELKKLTEPPKSFFSPTALHSLYITFKFILCSVFVLLVFDSLGVPLLILLIIMGLLLLIFLIYGARIVNEISSAIIIRSSLPLEIGDIIRVDEIIGSVAAFTTKFLKLITPDKSAFYIPYKMLKDAAVENLSERKSRRYRHNIFVDPAVTAKATEKFLQKVNEFLSLHDNILNADATENTNSESDSNTENIKKKSKISEQGKTFAYLMALSRDGYEILIQYRIGEAEFHEAARVSESILLNILTIAEETGVKKGVQIKQQKPKSTPQNKNAKKKKSSPKKNQQK